jgi:hypothetical protein
MAEWKADLCYICQENPDKKWLRFLLVDKGLTELYIK